MSKFVTTIATDIAEVIDKLPQSSHIHSITLNPDKTISIVWDNDKHKTPYTFPLECPVEKLDEIAAKNTPPTEPLNEGQQRWVDSAHRAINAIEKAVTEESIDKVKVDKRTKEYKESLRNAQNSP